MEVPVPPGRYGLRRQYLNDLYQRYTGHPSPVEGGTIDDRALHEAAMKIVVEAAGHSRKYKSQAYLGGPDAKRIDGLNQAMAAGGFSVGKF